MKINVCVGSSCHLKGSYDVIKKIQELLEKHCLTKEVDLQAGFCLGHCSEGVTVKMDDEYLLNVNKENVEEIFMEKIYTALKVGK